MKFVKYRPNDKRFPRKRWYCAKRHYPSSPFVQQWLATSVYIDDIGEIRTESQDSIDPEEEDLYLLLERKVFIPKSKKFSTK